MVGLNPDDGSSSSKGKVLVEIVDDGDDDFDDQLALLSCSAAVVPLLTESNSDDASTILNLSDYSPSTWISVVSYGVPTIGIAVLALTHPILFLAGASIVGMGGAYAVGDCGSLCGGDAAAAAATTAEKEEPTIEKDLPLTILTNATACDDLDGSKQLISAELTDDEDDEDDDDDSPLPAPLSHTIVDNAVFSSLHAKDFFKIFFGDDAPFSFKSFQKQRGDINIVYSPWHNNQRVISFQTPARTPFFGPSHATATKTQVLKVHSKSCVIMESTTSLRDIPFSDRFTIAEQWIFTSTPEKQCTVTVSAQPNFSKSCAFEAQIEQKSMSTLREALTSWRSMAHKALILTEKNRKQEVPEQEDEIEVAFQTRGSCIVGEEVEEDWEMDPAPVKSPKRASLKILKRSLTWKFTKKQPAVLVS